MAKFTVDIVRGIGARYTVKCIPEREGDVIKEDISIAKASMLLDWVPEISLKEGLQISYNHLKKEWNK